MRTWIFRSILVTLIALSVGFLFLGVSTPKFILLDHLLSRRGVYITAGDVEESILSVDLKDVRVSTDRGEILRMDRSRFGVAFEGVYWRGVCGNGTLRVLRTWGGGLKVSAVRFPCFRGASMVDADIEVGNGIWGDLNLEGLDLRGVVVDRIDLKLEGDRFTGSVRAQGTELRGRGRFRFDPEDPASTYAEGTFRGNGLTLQVRGEIGNMNLQIR